jgi:hypothetical protein
MKTYLRHDKILDNKSSPATEPTRVEISSYSLHQKMEIGTVAKKLRLLKY